MANKGVTFMELLVVLVIVTILVSLSVGNFSRSSEKNKAKEAEANLQLIYSAQQRYFLDEGQYYSCCDSCVSSCDDIDDSDSGLGIKLTGDNFTYEISATTSPNAFTATATRNGGPCDGKMMTITNQSGLVTAGCDQW